LRNLSEVPRPAWIEVDLAAIKNNIRAVRAIVRPQTEIMAVVKANAYGHGIEKIAFTLLDNGADRLGVATLGEGVSLRLSGIMAPVLVLGYVPGDQVDMAIKYHISQTVYSLNEALSISKKACENNKKATIHIKIDSGMGRIGFLPTQESVRDICCICQLPGLYVEGIYTHFAKADYADKAYTRHQLAVFTQMLADLKDRNCGFDICHAANSAAMIDMPETHFDLVRPGIVLYGHYPSEEVDKHKIKLKPALSLKARISHVKRVPAGTPISYGCCYYTAGDSVIASLPLGYADGYLRRFCDDGCEVLLRGQRVKIVGTICMDQMMLDVTSLPEVKVGEEVVLIGAQGDDRITLEELASKNGTINYEIVCMLSERLPRIYING